MMQFVVGALAGMAFTIVVPSLALVLARKSAAKRWVKIAEAGHRRDHAIIDVHDASFDVLLRAFAPRDSEVLREIGRQRIVRSKAMQAYLEAQCKAQQ